METLEVGACRVSWRDGLDDAASGDAVALHPGQDGELGRRGSQEHQSDKGSLKREVARSSAALEKKDAGEEKDASAYHADAV